MSASEFPDVRETGKNTPEDGDWHQDMTSRAVLLAQARQGDPTAIATLINQSLKTKNVTIQVRQKGELYQILVQAPEAPHQPKTVQWLTKGLTKLEIPNLKQVVIWGKAINASKPTWQEHVDFATSASDKSTTVQTPAEEPALDLSNYCFTRNQALLKGTLAAPPQSVAQLVLDFEELTNPQKLETLPLLNEAFRDSQRVDVETLDEASQQWLQQLSTLETTKQRKLAIWMSRYCRDPGATLEQLRPMTIPVEPPAEKVALEVSPEASPELLQEPDEISSALANTPIEHSSHIPRRAAEAAEAEESYFRPKNRPAFSRGSLPAWTVPVGWLVCMSLFILLGINSATRSSFPICANSMGTPEACELAVQLAGEDTIATAIDEAVPVTPLLQEWAIKDCVQTAELLVTAPDLLEGDGKKNKVIPISKETYEIFEGVLLSDISVQKVVNDPDGQNQKSFRVVCVQSTYDRTKHEPDAEDYIHKHIVGELAARPISLKWPEEPYSEAEARVSALNKTASVYAVFIRLGAYMLFSVVGVFLAVLFCSCYTCYTLEGIYKTAFVLGLIETVIFYIPFLGGYLYGIIAEIIAVGLTSLVVKEFNVDWRDGFGALAMGAAVIICTRLVLSFVLFAAIAYFFLLGI